MKIIKGNLKPYLANLTFATRMETLAELKHECKRAEKLIWENRSSGKVVSEINEKDWATAWKPEGEVEIEALGRENTNNVSTHKPMPGTTNHREVSRPISSSFNPSPSKASSVSASCSDPNQTFCTSPFHFMLCFASGMPVDYYIKNPTEAAKGTKCKSSFHCMKSFACGGDASFCVFKPEAGNRALAEMTWHSGQNLNLPDATELN